MPAKGENECADGTPGIPPVNNTRRAKPVKADKRVEKARQLK